MVLINRQTLLTGMVTIFCTITVGLCNSVVNSDFVILIFYLLYICWILSKRREVFLKYFYFILMSSWQVISVFAIENVKMYLPNLKTTSYHTGAFVPLVVVEIIVLFVITLLEDNRAKKDTTDIGLTRLGKTSYKFIGLIAVVVIFAFVAEISNKNYYISGASDRFYYTLALNAVSIGLYGYLIFLYPLLTINAEKNGKPKALWIFTFFYVIYIFLIGQKFGPFIQTLYFLLLTYFLPFKKSAMNKYYKKILMAIVIIGTALLILSVRQMTIEKGSIEAGVEQFYNRLFNGQGDVWWGVYSRHSNEGLHLNELKDELGAFSAGKLLQQNYNFGVYKMMKLVAPNSIILYYAQRGARFTASTNASLFYYFGIPGLIVFKIILAFLMYFLCNKIIDSCRKGFGLEGVLYVWLMSHFTRVYYMSSFDLFLSTSAIGCYILLLANHFWGRRLSILNK